MKQGDPRGPQSKSGICFITSRLAGNFYEVSPLRQPMLITKSGFMRSQVRGLGSYIERTGKSPLTSLRLTTEEFVSQTLVADRISLTCGKFVASNILVWQSADTSAPRTLLEKAGGVSICF